MKLLRSTYLLLLSLFVLVHSTNVFSAVAETEIPDGWLASCSSAGRSAPADCSITQKLVINETGQTLVAVTVRVSAPGAQPAYMIQVPVGIYLPAGVNIRIGDKPPIEAQIQMCDASGCYVGATLDKKTLADMKAGDTLTIGLQSIQKQALNIEVPLKGFTKGYNLIK